MPKVKPLEIEDTAIGAYKLKSGEYKNDVAVLCRKNAGEINNLHLLFENIEDNKDNATEFALFKKA
jgi:prephenate dehydratase